MPIFPASLASAVASIWAALKRHITLALFAVALIASALFVHAWLDARRAATQLAATLAAQQKIISDADARQSARDAALSQTLAQIDALKRSVQTPRQASAALAQTLPQFIAASIPPALRSFSAGGLPAPLQFIPYPSSSGVSSSAQPPASSPGVPQPVASPGVPPQENVVILSAAKDPSAAATSPVTGKLAPPALENLGSLSSLKSEILSVRAGHPISPSSAPPTPQQGLPSAASAQQGTAVSTAAPIPGSICIPPADLKPLYDSIENCEACAAKLTASQADLTDERAKFDAASTERDAALRAARGTFWTRTARAAKWIAIGAAAGAIIARYH